MKQLQLTRGKVALIDDDDFEKASRWKWTALVKKNTSYAYRMDTIRVEGKKYRRAVYLHRFIMKPPSNMQIDHINHDGLDNRRTNLRIVTPLQNYRSRRPYKPWNKGHKKKKLCPHCGGDLTKRS